MRRILIRLSRILINDLDVFLQFFLGVFIDFEDFLRFFLHDAPCDANYRTQGNNCSGNGLNRVSHYGWIDISENPVGVLGGLAEEARAEGCSSGAPDRDAFDGHPKCGGEVFTEAGLLREHIAAGGEDERVAVVEEQYRGEIINTQLQRCM